MRILRYILGSVLVLSLFAMPACDDDGDDTTSDTGTPTDTGNDSSNGGSDVEADCRTSCWTPLPSAGTNPRLVLEAVQYTPDDVVIVKNISGAALDFNGWQICHEQTCAAIGAVNVPQGDKLAIYLNESGTNSATEVFVDTFADLSNAGEIAVYNSDDFDSSSALVGFVRWGNAGGGDSRVGVAVSGGNWEGASAFLPVCDGHEGLVAVGNVTLVRGWKSQPAGCF